VKKPSSRLYKFINFIIKGIVYFLILIHLLLYGWYKYELLSVDLSPYKVKSKSYKSDYYAVFWAIKENYSMTSSQDSLKIKPIYPVYDAVVCMLGYDCSYYLHHQASPSFKITYSLVNKNNVYRNERFKKFMIQVWISHHLTFEEVATLYFDKAYYGRNYYGLKIASQGYFGKEPNALNRYQIIMLIALSEYPNLDPLRRAKKLMSKMSIMLFTLYKVFPVYYTKSASIREIKSRVIIDTVEESARFLKDKNLKE